MTPREPFLAATNASQEQEDRSPPSLIASVPYASRRIRRPSVALTVSDSDDIMSIVSRRMFGLGCGHVARRTLGIGLLLVTVFLWTASNFLASYIFSDNTYDKPFFLVYFNTSFFAASLIPIAIRHIKQIGGLEPFLNESIQEWKAFQKGAAVGTERSRSRSRSRSQGDGPDERELGERLLTGDLHNDEEDDFESILDDESDSGETKKLAFFETARLSLEFAMIWFLGNYFASACLEYTSVASVTILTSTSSVWTLIFCALARIETFSLRKLLGVLASLAGVVMISLVDLSPSVDDGSGDGGRGDFPFKSRTEIAVGDAMAFFSAVIYGVYVVVMKMRVGSEERVNMPLFFGLVGLWNILLLWPLFPILHYTGIEPFETPPSGKVWTIIILNSLSSFVSDISWAYALLLTTPLVVTVGLSLTIPLSLIGEMIQYNQYSSFVYWVGAVVVVFSFVFISFESHEGDTNDKTLSVEEDI